MTTPKSVLRKLLLVAIVVFGLDASFADAQRPGWSPVIIATGQYRQQIKSLPIEKRPNRPFHFYGNAVRRSYYQGGPAAISTMSVGSYPSQSAPYSVARPPMNYYVAPPVYSNTPTVVRPVQSW